MNGILLLLPVFLPLVLGLLSYFLPIRSESCRGLVYSLLILGTTSSAPSPGVCGALPPAYPCAANARSRAGWRQALRSAGCFPKNSASRSTCPSIRNSSEPSERP